MAVQLSHVSKGIALSQAEFESASSHDLDGAFDLGSNLLVGNGGSTGIAISANGEVTLAAQPGFLANNSVTDSNATGSGGAVTVDYDTEIIDQNGDFATDTFTAPVTGSYFLRASVNGADITTASTQMVLIAVTSNRSHQLRNVAGIGDGAGSFFSLESSIIADMDANDTVTITYEVTGESGDPVDVGGGTDMRTSFAGWLLG